VSRSLLRLIPVAVLAAAVVAATVAPAAASDLDSYLEQAEASSTPAR